MNDVLDRLQICRGSRNFNSELYSELLNMVNLEFSSGADKGSNERFIMGKVANMSPSLQEVFRNTKQLLSSENELENVTPGNRQLLIVIMDLINSVSVSYKERLLNNDMSSECEDLEKEINVIIGLLHVIIITINIFNRKKDVMIEKKCKQIYKHDKNNLNKMIERLNYLEENLETIKAGASTLNTELVSVNKEFLTYQEHGASGEENNKLFSENINVTLIRQELESLRKYNTDMEYTNITLEHKVVDLLNEINTLVSKNVMLEEERNKHLKKSNVNTGKHLAKSELLIQISEQKETITNMTAHNEQLNALIVELKNDNKFCSRSYATCRGIIAEREMENIELKKNLQKLKMINKRLENTLDVDNKRIEELEMDLFVTTRKMEDLFLQLAASEALRLSQKIAVDYQSTSQRVSSLLGAAELKHTPGSQVPVNEEQKVAQEIGDYKSMVGQGYHKTTEVPGAVAGNAEISTT